MLRTHSSPHHCRALTGPALALLTVGLLLAGLAPTPAAAQDDHDDHSDHDHADVFTLLDEEIARATPVTGALSVTSSGPPQEQRARTRPSMSRSTRPPPSSAATATGT